MGDCVPDCPLIVTASSEIIETGSIVYLLLATLFFIHYVPVDAPVITQDNLMVTTNMELCPNASILFVGFVPLESIIGLKYELIISSSMNCELEECPMQLSTDQRNLNFTVRNDVNYNVTLIASNDCGSSNTTETIQPGK